MGVEGLASAPSDISRAETRRRTARRRRRPSPLDGEVVGAARLLYAGARLRHVFPQVGLGLQDQGGARLAHRLALLLDLFVAVGERVL